MKYRVLAIGIKFPTNDAEHERQQKCRKAGKPITGRKERSAVKGEEIDDLPEVSIASFLECGAIELVSAKKSKSKTKEV